MFSVVIAKRVTLNVAKYGKCMSTCTDKVQSVYPGAVTNSDLVSKAKSALAAHGYGEKTLLATSLCCDEINRVLDRDFGAVYDVNFSMGGLAGFPFGGVTSFGAMAHHIPDGGDCLVVFGPHVGVDADGVVGKVNRRGMANSGACCGSACAAAGHVACALKGEVAPQVISTDVVDAQQTFVNNLLLPYAERLDAADDTMAELPRALYDAQKKIIDQIIAAGCQEVGGDGKIALLGGIQINTPESESDYFLPMDFEVRSNKNETIATLSI
jgi:hypothetical protein